MPRPSRDFRSSSKENFEVFCKERPEVKIDYATFKKIIYTWNNMYVKHMLDTGDRLKLAYGLGPLAVTMYKPKRYKKNKEGKEIIGLPINWKETKKEGRYIYHLNYQTDGYKYYWYWNPHESYIRNAVIWKLEMARVHSRALSSILQNPNDLRKHTYKQWKLK